MDMDEELLDGEDGSDSDFEITNEKEEALLQDDEEYSKSKDAYDEHRDASDEEEYPSFRDRYEDFKKSSMSDAGEEDVLNLDAEEDFQDVDEKIMCEEEPKKKVTENIQKIKSVSEPSVKSTKTVKRNDTAPKRINNNVPSKKNPPPRRIPPRNDKRKRGIGRGNFQTRSNFGNNAQRKRNGTVLINPRYEGTVQINENSARLAWDNSQYPQNNTNFVQPWASGNYDTNITTSQLLKNILVQSRNMLIPPIQPAPQNYYQPPPNNYEKPLVFEPPPNIQEQARQSIYDNQQQVSNHPMYSSTQPSTSLPPYPSRGSQHEYDSQGMKGENRTFDTYPSYGYNTRQNYSFQPKKNENRNFSYNRSNSRPGTYSNNNATYNNNQNKNLFGINNGYQNRYPSYSNNSFKHENFSNYEVKNDGKEFNSSGKGGRNEKQSTYQFKADSTTSSANKDANFTSYQNPSKERFKSIGLNETHQVPEKKVKFQENATAVDNYTKETSLKPESTTSAVLTEEEDEETRLYRLKIEEQKKERERLLKIKEERRKQMLLQQLKSDEAKLVSQEIQHQQVSNQNSVTESMNFRSTNTFKHSGRTEQQLNVVNPVQRPVQQYSRQSDNRPFNYQRQKQHSTNQAFVQKSNQYFAHPPSSGFPQKQFYDSGSSDLNLGAEVSNETLKMSDLKFVVQDKTLSSVPKTEASSSSFMSNRVVVVKSNNKDRPSLTSSINEASKRSSDVDKGFSSFLNNRKVLKKDTALLNTRLVVVNNLSTTINQNKLMALTRGVGEIQTLRVDKQERQATILFKTVASAHAFFKKNQRRILDDLSVIEAKLEPMI